MVLVTDRKQRSSIIVGMKIKFYKKKNKCQNKFVFFFRFTYLQSLKGLVQKRYLITMVMCEGIDPFTILVFDDVANEPALSAFDVVTYLTTITSFYTGNQAKAYKSLDAFKFHEAKYVHHT